MAATSLKPASAPLMDSGQALAKSGELLIDATSDWGLYGGGISSAGAALRNAGDRVAQAAASCRFKTGTELVSDELREGADCLQQAAIHLQSAIADAAKEPQTANMAAGLEESVAIVKEAAILLEQAGAGIFLQGSLVQVGDALVQCGTQLVKLSSEFSGLAPLGASTENLVQACQRLAVAASQMKQAGQALRGSTSESGPKPKGKGWIKG